MKRRMKLLSIVSYAALLLLLALLHAELPPLPGESDPLRLARAGAPVYRFSARETLEPDDLAVTWGVEEWGEYVAIRYNLFLAQDTGIDGVRVTLADGRETSFSSVAGVRLRGFDEHLGDVETLWKIWHVPAGGAVEEVAAVIQRHGDYVIVPEPIEGEIVLSAGKHAQFLDVAECLGQHYARIAGVRLSTEYCDDEGLAYPARIARSNRWNHASEWAKAVGRLGHLFEVSEAAGGKWCVRPRDGDGGCRAILTALPDHVWEDVLRALEGGERAVPLVGDGAPLLSTSLRPSLSRP